TALASRYVKKLKTFSVTFKGRGYYDESRFAKRIADLFGAEHNEVEVSPNLKSELEEIVDFLDEPFADSSYIPTYYLAKATRSNVKVALSGTGGDDIFAGYRRYTMNYLISIIEKFPFFVRKAASCIVKNIQKTRSTISGEKAILLERLLAAAEREKRRRHTYIMSFIDREMQRYLIDTSQLNLMEEYQEEVLDDFDEQSDINQELYSDFISYLPGDLLKKEDCATMAVALEARLPLLDHRLVEFSCRVVPALKVKKLTTKYILRKAFEETIPRQILYREKHGFAFPIGEYLKDELRDLFIDTILTAKHRYFDNKKVMEIFSIHQSGKKDFSQHLWAIFIFNLWYKTNG
ncbi:MAG TPA: hypothetical protein EYP78_01920, partial [Candidatus Omnitrophica bacterium]|nr:hypothetical protein [Candidatus Omnitrophota bacterium]